MTPPKKFSASSVELRKHAQDVQGQSQKVSMARHAVDHVKWDFAAYGPLCAALPVILGTVGGQVASGLETLQQSLAHTATQLCEAADSYDKQDQAARGDFDRLMAELR